VEVQAMSEWWDGEVCYPLKRKVLPSPQGVSALPLSLFFRMKTREFAGVLDDFVDEKVHER